MEKYDVVVIGGGPAGCKTAEYIGAKSRRVMVVEEHLQIGEPLQCAGLISPRTLTAAGVTGEVVKNSIRGAVVHAPSGEELIIRGHTTYALVIDRAGFDRALSERAQSKGVTIVTGTRAEVAQSHKEGVNIRLKSGSAETAVCAKLVIGADGPNSRVARHIGSPALDNRVLMSAAEVETECQQLDMVHIFLGREVAPGWFGWLIPVDKHHARIGTGVSISKGNDAGLGAGKPLACLERLLMSYPRLFKGLTITRYTGGFIPVGRPAAMFSERTLLVGDAACQVKPVSGGGLYLGMLGAGLCAEAAIGALAEENFTAPYLAGYQKAWETAMSDEIRVALRHREAFLSFSDQDMNDLIRFFKKPLWQSIILKYGDIDYISRLAGRLSFASPWANKFLRYLSAAKTSLSSSGG